MPRGAFRVVERLDGTNGPWAGGIALERANGVRDEVCGGTVVLTNWGAASAPAVQVSVGLDAERNRPFVQELTISGLPSDATLSEWWRRVRPRDIEDAAVKALTARIYPDGRVVAPLLDHPEEEGVRGLLDVGVLGKRPARASGWTDAQILELAREAPNCSPPQRPSALIAERLHISNGAARKRLSRARRSAPND